MALLRATKVTEKVSDVFRRANVAAIDFGTTSCSLAYKTHGDDEVLTYKFDVYYERVPNALMVRPQNDGTVEIVQYGMKARKAYLDNRKRDVRGCIYFERIKMLLERDESVGRNSKVEAKTGGKFYLVEVIAFILKHLKASLIKQLASLAGRPPTAEDFTWVITVPAIWRDKGKRMMREAACMACLTSNDEGIVKFTPVTSVVSRPHEDHSGRLLLALEPEAAALHARGCTMKVLEALQMEVPSTFLVNDAGGGTVDVTVHHEQGGKIDVTSCPAGKGCAGNRVNEEFAEMVSAKILRDDGFADFHQNGKDPQQNIDKLVYDSFEDKKLEFANKFTERNFAIAIPDDIKRKCLHKIENNRFDGVSYCNDKLHVDLQSFLDYAHNPDNNNEAIEKFEELLQEILDDDSVEKESIEMMVDEFEKQVFDKFQFVIDIPQKMIDYYKKSKFVEGVRNVPGVLFDNDYNQLVIWQTKMEDLFKPSIDAVVESTKTGLAGTNDVREIYLVGGLGASDYVKKMLLPNLPSHLQDKVSIPATPRLAVVKGAVLWGLNPTIIASRRANATYGIILAPKFNDSIHDSHYKYFDDEYDVYRCGKVFCVFLEKGEKSSIGETYTKKLLPASKNVKIVSIGIYCTERVDVKYSVDRSGNSMLNSIGKIEIDVSNSGDLPANEREVEAAMDFSGTEIKVTATYCVTGEKVQTVCDFFQS